MHVLNLVTTRKARFFVQQVDGLADLGVEQTTLAVPGSRTYGDGKTASRSAFDYVRFAGDAFLESFGDYDLVHANYGLTAPPAVLQPNLPSVVSLWGSDLMGRYGWFSRQCARRADAVVVMSEEMARELGRPCHVIPHGVNLERFAPRDRDSAREAIGWDPDAYHVLFPYPPEREVKDHPRATYIVDRAGRDLDRPVELHSVTGVPHEEMPTYMNAADVLLVTSRHEGSPNAVKEAMACNLPVVATDVGDVAERLADVDPSTVADDDASLVEGVVSVLEAGVRSDGRAAAAAVSDQRANERLHEVYRTVLEGAP